MKKDSNKVGGWKGLVFIGLLFILLYTIYLELKKGNILLWIYLIGVVTYIYVFGTKGLT